MNNEAGDPMKKKVNELRSCFAAENIVKLTGNIYSAADVLKHEEDEEEDDDL